VPNSNDHRLKGVQGEFNAITRKDCHRHRRREGYWPRHLPSSLPRRPPKSGRAGQDLIQATVDHYGQLDILINNAARWEQNGHLLEIDEKMWGYIIGGFVNTGGNLGGFLAALLTPWFAEEIGWVGVFDVASLLALAGAVVWRGVNPSLAKTLSI